MTFASGSYASRYFATLDRIARSIRASDASGAAVSFDSAMTAVSCICHDVDTGGGKLMFIGNGGSASIASHMAVDFTKNGGMRAWAFNDPAILTCLANDLGYENVFSFQIERHADAGDLLFAISSSGRSPNILNGVTAARHRGSKVVTMSGFADDNPLRSCGDLNFYVPSAEYGYVELLHCSLCHCILDGLMDVKVD